MSRDSRARWYRDSRYRVKMSEDGRWLYADTLDEVAADGPVFALERWEGRKRDGRFEPFTSKRVEFLERETSSGGS